MPIEHCNVCIKSINIVNHKALHCRVCKLWTHKKCNKLNDIDYNLQKSNSSWFCIVCIDELFPFGGVTDKELTLINFIDNFSNIDLPSSDLNLFPSFINNKLFTKFHDFFVSQTLSNSEEDDISSNPINCKYYNIDEFCSSSFDNKDSFSVFHLNVASLSSHFDELNAIISLLNFNFSVLGLTETRIKINSGVTVPLAIEGYSYEHTPTESSCGGAMLYISNKFNYKPRNDLLVYKPLQLETVFVEIIIPRKSNLIVGCIYRHPCMSINEFNNIMCLQSRTK